MRRRHLFGTELADDRQTLTARTMVHETVPEICVYVHERTGGDLVVWDNRCLVHAATWFAADPIERLMWRSTASGNPGARYAGERKSCTLQPHAAA